MRLNYEGCHTKSLVLQEVFKEYKQNCVLANESENNVITGLRGKPLLWLDDHFTFKASLMDS